MNSRIKSLIQQKEEITKDLEEAILNQVVLIAKEMNLDSVMWHAYGTRYERNGVEVKSKRLDKLDDLYCDNVSAGGLEFYWEKDKGFVS